MLHRSIYTTVVELIPDTLARLQDWDGQGTPGAAVLTSMAVDLKRLAAERTSGKLAEALNRGLPGTSSVVKSTARAMGRVEDAELAANGAALLLAQHEKWAAPGVARLLRFPGYSQTRQKAKDRFAWAGFRFQEQREGHDRRTQPRCTRY